MSAFAECVRIGLRAYRLAREHYRREPTEAFGQIDVELVDRPLRRPTYTATNRTQPCRHCFAPIVWCVTLTASGSSMAMENQDGSPHVCSGSPS